jgi:hypothetical protein
MEVIRGVSLSDQVFIPESQVDYLICDAIIVSNLS